MNIKDYPLIIKNILQSDLIFFIRFFFKEIYGEKFIINWHHIEIAKKLTDVYNGIVQNLVINMPPRHGKTTMLIFFTAWAIAKNPKSKFIYISSSDKLTNENSRFVRSIITHPISETLFGVKISKDTKAKGLWHTDSLGGIMSSTISGQITGFGAGAIHSDTFAGAIVIDDPNKIRDYMTELERVPIDRFEDTIRNRRNGGNRTPIIINQQRTYLNDLSGYFYSDKTGLNYDKLIFPVIDNGVPLWAEKMGIDEIEQERTNSDYSFVFEAQYMQNPIPKLGTIFSDIKFYDHEIIPEQKIIMCDPSDGSDYFAAAVGTLCEGKIYIEDAIFNKYNLSTGVVILKDFIEKNKPDILYIETNIGGMALSEQFISHSKTFNYKYIPIKSTTNKLIRIVNEEIFIKENFYFKKTRSNEFNLFMNNFIFFNTNMKNKHDDAPDVIASISKYYRMLFQKLKKHA